MAPLARAVCLLVLLALVAPVAANAYSWPLRPFYKAHAIRGYFNDPRVVGGTTSFHFGVDIIAADLEPVYAIEAGQARVRATAVSIVGKQRTMSYWHIVPAVQHRQHVAFHQLVGYVQPDAGHLHLAEHRNGTYINPLRIGGLAPYIDDTVPRIPAMTFYSVGRSMQLDRIQGIVDLTVDAHDLSPLPLPPPDWLEARLAPALIRWRIVQPQRTVQPWQSAVDFRTFLLPSSVFSFVYAPGTYQNRPARPGRYEYYLARNLDTRTLPNGPSWLEVEASDTQKNVGRARFAFIITN